MISLGLWIRGMVFRGRRHRCPLCGWRVRNFCHGGGSFRVRTAGYCPRCNSKARHRRYWLFLRDRTDLLSRPRTVVEVGPHYSMARALSSIPHLRYTGIGMEPGPGQGLLADMTRAPIRTGSVDAVFAFHVLEHVVDDRAMIGEIYRILRPGGVAVVGVPLTLDRPTFEDSSITDPEQRRREFGEPGHVRRYGFDLTERLTGAGFRVEFHAGFDIDPGLVATHGLSTDEHLMLCAKEV